MDEDLNLSNNSNKRSKEKDRKENANELLLKKEILDLKYRLKDEQLENRKYEKLNTELFEKMKQSNQKIEEMKMEKEILVADVERLNQEIENLKGIDSISELTGQYLDNRLLMKEQERKIDTLKLDIQKMKNEMKNKEEAEKNFNSKYDKLDNEKNTVQNDLNKAKELNDANKKKIEKLEEKVKELTEQMRKLTTTDVSSASKSTDLQTLQDTIKKLSSCFEMEKKKVQKKVDRKKQVKEKLQEVQNENFLLLEKIDKMNSIVTEAKMRSQSLQVELGYAESENRISEARLKKIELKKNEVSSKIISSIHSVNLPGINFELEPRVIVFDDQEKLVPRVIEMDVFQPRYKDCYIIETLDNIYLINGKDATEKRTKDANNIVDEIIKNRPQGAILPNKHIFEKGVVPNNHFYFKFVSSKLYEDFFNLLKNEELGFYTCEYITSDQIAVSPDKMGNGKELRSTATYILNCGFEMYVWYGKQTGINYRRKTLLEAEKMKKYEWIQVIKVIEGEEITLFTSKFESWTRYEEEKVEEKPKEHRPEDLLEWKASIDEEFYDTYGTKMVWLVTDLTKKLMSDEYHGSFYKANSFVIYFRPTGSEKDVKEGSRLWFWQGSESKHDLKSVSHIVDQIRKDYGSPPFLAFREGFEPPHLIALFSGQMVIFNGECETFDNFSLLSFFEVRGTKESDTVTVQCNPCAKNLNSFAVFIISSPKITYIWHGDLSNEFQQQIADTLCFTNIKSDRKFVIRIEGTEPEEFWNMLGGQQPYYKTDKKNKDEIKPVKLFVNLNASIFVPAIRFSQNYLAENAIAILDTYDDVFFWAGPYATFGNKNLSKMYAEEYISVAKDGRTNKKVTVVEPFKEPYEFTKHFHAWNYSIVGEISYNKQVEKVVEQYKCFYTLDELKNKYLLPLYVDQQKLEDYLKSEEFPKAFGMTKEIFYRLPMWKRNNLKRKIDLF